MVAVHLARLAGPEAPRVVLFEKSERMARGIAYGTRCDQHLLNVPAGLMSALPDEPTHFLDWLRAVDPSAHAGTFAPRRVYGDYLEALLHSSAKTSTARIDFVRDEVVDMDLGDDCNSVHMKTRKASVCVRTAWFCALGIRCRRSRRGSSLRVSAGAMSPTLGHPAPWATWPPMHRSRSSVRG